MKFFSFLVLLALGTTTVEFNSCGNTPKQEEFSNNLDNPSNDKGVVINGVKWATRNVAEPGTFAAKLEDHGMFYQWNRKTTWPTDNYVTGWHNSFVAGCTWEKANDPSPAGWRVPTLAEIEKLCDANNVTSEWITLNGVNGRKFIDIATGNSIFLPAAGYRYYYGGTLNYVDSCGHYWSSTAYGSGRACRLSFVSGRAYWGWDCGTRSDGVSVRSVAD